MLGVVYVDLHFPLIVDSDLHIISIWGCSHHIFLQYTTFDMAHVIWFSI